jgi:hypothetical protein
MMVDMKHRLIGWGVAAAMWLTPLAARASDEKEPYDARLEGYGANVTLDGNSGLTWLLLVVLGALCVGVLFKNSKRSHLD